MKTDKNCPSCQDLSSPRNYQAEEIVCFSKALRSESQNPRIKIVPNINTFLLSLQIFGSVSSRKKYFRFGFSYFFYDYFHNLRFKFVETRIIERRKKSDSFKYISTNNMHGFFRRGRRCACLLKLLPAASNKRTGFRKELLSLVVAAWNRGKLYITQPSF